MAFMATITIDGEETTEEFWRTIWLPALNGRSGEVKVTALPGAGIGELPEEETVTVFGIDGVRVLDGAPASELKNLPKGLYIVNGRKTAL